MRESIGRYRVLEKIGVGGMGAVYRAADPAVGREVALKWLPEQFSARPTLVTRFQREARLIARLEHAHIVPIYDVGEAEGRPFIVMRLLTGGALRDRVARPDFDTAALLRTLAQVAEALEAAHGRQIVHRDVKPGNILFDESGTAFLSDFGIAKVLDTATTQLTASGAWVGTPAYMAPEQFTDEEVDGRCDQYALAVVAFEALSGRTPFEGNAAQMVYKHLSATPPDVHEINARIPAGVSPVLKKALAKKPQDRYRTAPAFVAALRAAVAEAPTQAPTVSTAATEEPATPPPTPAAPPSHEDEVAEQLARDYQQGLEAMNRSDWKGAIDAFDRVVQVDRYYRSALTLRRQVERKLSPSRRSVRLRSKQREAGGEEEAPSAWARLLGLPRGVKVGVVGGIGMVLVAVLVLGLLPGRERETPGAAAQDAPATTTVPSPTAITTEPASPTLAPTSPGAMAAITAAGPDATVSRNDGEGFQPLAEGDQVPVTAGTVIRSGTEDVLVITLPGDTQLFLAPETEIEFNNNPAGSGESAETHLQLNAGQIVAQVTADNLLLVGSRFGDVVEMATPNGLVGVIHNENGGAAGQFVVDCFQGPCILTGNTGNAITLADGERGMADAGRPAMETGSAHNELYADLEIVSTLTPTPRAIPTSTPTPSPTSLPSNTPVPATATPTPTPSLTNTPILDSDGDGINDNQDDCPYQWGPPEHGGCPPPPTSTKPLPTSIPPPASPTPTPYP